MAATYKELIAKALKLEAEAAEFRKQAEALKGEAMREAVKAINAEFDVDLVDAKTVAPAAPKAPRKPRKAKAELTPEQKAKAEKSEKLKKALAAINVKEGDLFKSGTNEYRYSKIGARPGWLHAHVDDLSKIYFPATAKK